MDLIAVDVETCSAADLGNGAWNYARHPSTHVLCVVFGWDEPTGRRFVRVTWTRDAALTVSDHDGLVDVLKHVHRGGRLLAHNAAFERAIWRFVLAPRWSWPGVRDDQWADTMPRGLALNLPASLEGLGAVLGCATQKNTGDDGSKLMKRLADDVVRDGDGWTPGPGVTPAALAKLTAYCQDDVGTTLDAWLRMPAPSMAEELVIAADWRVNGRGVFMDRELAAAIARVAELRRAELADEMFAATGGCVGAPTEASGLAAWVEARGVELPTKPRKKADGTYHRTASLDRGVVSALLAAESADGALADALRVRREAGYLTSLAKLKRVPGTVDPDDGRLRDTLRYCAAGTGRWASYGVQIHNLPKTKLSRAELALARAIVLDAGSSPADLRWLDERPLYVLSQLLRGTFAAAPGHELIAADYSAIEARVVAWLAYQDDVVAFFDRYDDEMREHRMGLRAKPRDYYEFTADGIGSTDRQLGKVCALALGYGMGALKFAETATAWGIPLDVRTARRTQQAWRQSKPDIVAFWSDLEDAVRAAIRDLGGIHEAGRVACVADASCLRLVLPSGRALRYWRPSVVRTEKMIRTVDDDGNVVERTFETEEIRFWKPVGKAMVLDVTYGGKLVENVTQAVARDLLAEALVRLDAGPYRVVMHVHDSLASEVEAGAGDVGEFCELITRLPSWASGLPVAADGYRSRYFQG